MSTQETIRAEATKWKRELEVEIANTKEHLAELQLKHKKCAKMVDGLNGTTKQSNKQSTLTPLAGDRDHVNDTNRA